MTPMRSHCGHKHFHLRVSHNLLLAENGEIISQILSSFYYYCSEEEESLASKVTG
jgi:hypothetical protein